MALLFYESDYILPVSLCSMRPSCEKKTTTEFMCSFEDVHSQGSAIFLYNQTFFSVQISLHCRKEWSFGSDISVKKQLCIVYTFVFIRTK